MGLAIICNIFNKKFIYLNNIHAITNDCNIFNKKTIIYNTRNFVHDNLFEITDQKEYLFHTLSTGRHRVK